jgi:exosortase A-associated hydrolase 1
MNHRDEAVRFDCCGDALVGILSRPTHARDTGVVILIGGPQYRAGGHRQYVLLARALAAAGYPVLRFDYRGNGDSGGERRTYENVSDDIAAAVDELQIRVPGLRQVVLWGLCGGASAALIYCHERHDSRVVGLCLMNPWVRTETSLARTHVKYYYLRRVLQPEFWRKLASGRMSLAALRDFVHNIQLARSASARTPGPMSFQDRMAAAWHAYAGHMLLMISGRDYTAKEFLDYVQAEPAWARAMEHPRLLRRDLPDADHTCSERPQRAAMQRLIVEWLSMLSHGDALSLDETADVRALEKQLP